MASYMKFLIEKDLDYVSEEQYQNIIKTVASINRIMSGLPGISSVLPTTKSRNPSVRTIGADLIPTCE